MNNPLDATGAVVRPAPAEELEQTLYEVRRKIYPRAVHGWFAGWRWALIWLTQLLFYGTAWFQWNGRQAVLFDLAARKFYVLGFVFWPQDFIYLTGAPRHLGAVAVSLHRGRRAAVVRLRLPADGLHRDLHVDRAQDRGRPAGADAARRRPVRGAQGRASRRPSTPSGSRWRSGPASRSSATSRRSASSLREVLAFSTGPWETFWILFYGFATYGNAGWMREQVCKYMCPYARFQGVMFDRDTMTVDLRRAARRAARRALAEGRLQGGRSRRLRRLHDLRAGLPHRHRHPQRPAVRVHRLRGVHRRAATR